MLGEGDHVGRYVIEGILGEGGMGTVYRAQDPVLDRKVALKVVRAPSGDDDGQKRSEGTARLLREARAAAALVHPSAVAIYDVGEVDGAPFIAMELVPGVTMRDKVGDHTVPVATRLRWLCDVARVLEAAHKLGIVHRDVKPDNVMVRADGAVKVLDFGIARKLETPFDAAAGGAAGTLTAKGTPIGTPLYMAPEQMLAEDVDGRADQFAWGVMAYELLTGELPWGQPKDGVGVMYAILKKEAEPFHQAHPEIPPDVETIVLRALQKEPDDRYPTMDELVLDLEGYAAPPDQGVPTSRLVSQRRDASSRRTMARYAPLAAVALAVAAVSAFAVVRLRTPAQPAGSARGSAAPPSSGPVAITDLPPPSSQSVEALTAYRAGVQAIRDGATGHLLENLGRATTLDPSLAAAHLRLALYGSNGGVPTRSTGSFQRAMQLRASLSPRDQELATAFEPYMNRERVNLAETERRLVALATRYPEDAEIAYLLAAVRFDTDARSMMSELDRASTLDPSFVPPIAIRAHGLAYLGDDAGARRAFERCAEVSPSSSLCAHYQASLDQQEGECARIEGMARRVLAAEPSSTSSLGMLASAAASLGRPRESVLALLEQKAAKTRADAQKQSSLRDLARLDLLYGDFDGAEAKAKELARAVSVSANQAAHASATLLLIDVYLETGRPKEAGKVADEFMKRRDAWVPPTNVEDYSIRDDATIPMLTAMRASGLLSPADFRTQRDRWLEDWRKVASPFYYGYLWIHGFAVPADSAADGQEAIAALGKWGPIPPYRSQTLVDGSIGNAFRLAGKLDEGLPFARRGARCCRALYEPVASTRASYFLGVALEEKADTAGACAAYKVVLDRWGAAKRSVTADKARARVRALSCK